MLKGTLAIVVALVLLGVSLAAMANEPLVVPKDAVLLNAVPLQCGAVILMYDGNNNPNDGAEWVALVRSGDETPLVVVEFEAGIEGDFKRAVVAIPGQPVQAFTSGAAMWSKYPDPCEVVRAAGERT